MLTWRLTLANCGDAKGARAEAQVLHSGSMFGHCCGVGVVPGAA